MNEKEILILLLQNPLENLKENEVQPFQKRQQICTSTTEIFQ